ncbi:hypothetical protein SeMB42_g01631 [Synchytrium endobioticum]|uniref:RRM domain-containing protein n=1 Tax=Synchytrium endobioticum TaxID=286115 RepID=A0A507DL41_9FUNG|nr:hypothetical protein SeMB42_g01631 [Synchytrium endobioticum]
MADEDLNALMDNNDWHYLQDERPPGIGSPQESSSLRFRSRSPRPNSLVDNPSSERDRARQQDRASDRDRDRGRDGRFRPVGQADNHYSMGIKREQPSKKECRVYVGNLAYECGWKDLTDFMGQVGKVVLADVLTQPNGRSKGCGVVEFSSADEAQRAIREMSDVIFMGRPVYVREDREMEAKFGTAPSRGRLGGGSSGSSGPPPSRPSDIGRAIFVGNLPYSAGWQDLKDQFRSAGPVIRADIQQDDQKRSKGCGVIVFETIEGAQKAIQMYNGWDWNGRKLEVREDKYAGRSNSGSFGGGRGVGLDGRRGYSDFGGPPGPSSSQYPGYQNFYGQPYAPDPYYYGYEQQQQQQQQQFGQNGQSQPAPNQQNLSVQGLFMKQEQNPSTQGLFVKQEPKPDGMYRNYPTYGDYGGADRK